NEGRALPPVANPVLVSAAVVGRRPSTFPDTCESVPHMWKGAVDNTSVVQADPQAERICAHLLELAKRDLAERSYNMWFADIRAGELSGGVLELVVPSDYVRDWLARNHSDLIDTAVTHATDGSVTARLVSYPAR